MKLSEFVIMLIGKQKALWLSIFVLGIMTCVSLVIGAVKYYPVYIVSPTLLEQQVQQLQEKQEKANTGFQIQLNEASMRTLQNEIFNLKKLKIKKMADDLDLEQLDEYKKQFDSLKAETDSLKKTLYKIK